MKTIKLAKTWPNHVNESTVHEYPAGWSGEVSDDVAQRALNAGVLEGKPIDKSAPARTRKPASKPKPAAKAKAPAAPAAPAARTASGPEAVTTGGAAATALGQGSFSAATDA